MGKYTFDVERYKSLARQAVAEGCVLLKNENHTLPLKKGDKVSILQETPEGTMVRKRGVTGWYYGKFQIQNGTDRRTVSENQT